MALILALIAGLQGCAAGAAAGCTQRTVATWANIARTLNDFANCNAATRICPGRNIPATSTTVVWQGSCTTNSFSIAAQDAMLTNAVQFASANAPSCPATGQPMRVRSWTYFTDHVGTSCVVRVNIHFECCGPAATD